MNIPDELNIHHHNIYPITPQSSPPPPSSSDFISIICNNNDNLNNNNYNNNNINSVKILKNKNGRKPNSVKSTLGQVKISPKSIISSGLSPSGGKSIMYYKKFQCNHYIQEDNIIIQCSERFHSFKEYLLHRSQPHADCIINCAGCNYDQQGDESIVSPRSLPSFYTNQFTNIPECDSGNSTPGMPHDLSVEYGSSCSSDDMGMYSDDSNSSQIVPYSIHGSLNNIFMQTPMSSDSIKMKKSNIVAPQKPIVKSPTIEQVYEYYKQRDYMENEKRERRCCHYGCNDIVHYAGYARHYSNHKIHHHGQNIPYCIGCDMRLNLNLIREYKQKRKDLNQKKKSQSLRKDPELKEAYKKLEILIPINDFNEFYCNLKKKVYELRPAGSPVTPISSPMLLGRRSNKKHHNQPQNIGAASTTMNRLSIMGHVGSRNRNQQSTTTTAKYGASVTESSPMHLKMILNDNNNGNDIYNYYNNLQLTIDQQTTSTLDEMDIKYQFQQPTSLPMSLVCSNDTNFYWSSNEKSEIQQEIDINQEFEILSSSPSKISI
ncbi:hypothetical protein DLAC_02773 [Tieghemostelium lacteum]|uniref:Uncharacterized protein n=1 Tax=Tieghemostelium lacteum TaxID=361077 RepID=A0A152A389_TIELA|nr:hypothetical protein DLAC_02773 [Tieghemostelium lacteum]|eukprot:KYR00732.1 hypothetical protein DLAC_02773 [Tieghemostelium lacteum]